MNIYLAGRFSARESLCKVRKRLEEYGHKITSSWLNEDTLKSFTSLSPEQCHEIAKRDLEDVSHSQLLILDLLLPPSKGGCEVEFGLVLAEPRYKFAYIVGKPRNIFHYLALKVFDEWEECIWQLRK